MPTPCSAIISCLTWQTDCFTDLLSFSFFVLFLSFFWSFQSLYSKSFLLYKYICLWQGEREAGKCTHFEQAQNRLHIWTRTYILCVAQSRRPQLPSIYLYILFDLHDIQKGNRHKWKTDLVWFDYEYEYVSLQVTETHLLCEEEQLFLSLSLPLWLSLSWPYCLDLSLSLSHFSCHM